MKLFTLNRFGLVKLINPSHNQCKEEGWLQYSYEIRVTCTDKLDDEDFVIEHSLIHNAVQDVFQNSGSCERLCLDTEKAVLKLLRSHGVKVKKLYVSIRPKLSVPLDNYAFMELESNYR